MRKKSNRARAYDRLHTMKMQMKPLPRRCPTLASAKPKPPSRAKPWKRWLRTAGKWATWFAGLLTTALKLLLVLVILMVLYCLYRQSSRVTRLLDLMSVGWSMLLQVMKRSGLVDRSEAPAELAKYVRQARNMTWPVCRRE